MKNILFFLFLSILMTSYSQNVGINAAGSAPDATAGLDVSFSDKGVLVPRLTLSTR